jgi:hypothetical protein
VKYIRSSFWPDRIFRDFNDLRAQCAQWLTEFANCREHRATRRIPDLAFEHEEKQHLMDINPHPYDTDEVVSKEVGPQYRLTYETNQYSVPWTLVGMTVTMRVDDESVRFFYGGKLVAHHPRCYGKHKEFTLPAHEAGLIERKPGADHHAWQVSLIKQSGESLQSYLKLISAGHRSLRSEVKRLVALITIYGAEGVNQAATELLTRGIVGAENLELLLKAQGAAERAPAPLTFQSLKLNRMTANPDLSLYNEFLFENGEQPARPAAELSQESGHDNTRKSDNKSD